MRSYANHHIKYLGFARRVSDFICCGKVQYVSAPKTHVGTLGKTKTKTKDNSISNHPVERV